MGWLVTLIVGGIVGWLASMIMKTNDQMGLLLNIIIGVVGSLLGYWLAGLIGIEAEGGFARFLIAIVGAVILIMVLKALGVFKRTG